MESEDFKNKLKKCETLKQIFDLVNEHYTSEQPLGIISGATVKSQVPGIIKMLNLKERKC